MFHRYFLTMCPTYAFIDRANAKFNRAMDFKKDYAAIISAAWEIDNVYEQFLTDDNSTSDHYQILHNYGLYEAETDPYLEERQSLIRRIIRADTNHPFKKRYLGDKELSAKDIQDLEDSMIFN